MNHPNGVKLNQPLPLTTDTKPTRQKPALPSFDQPVILQQSPIWSRAIVWGIIGVTTFSVIWACVAKIEEAVPVTGKLEPQGTVQAVQAPVAGVVTAVHVRDGDHVEPGELLLNFDPTAAEAQQGSLEQVRQSLIRENQFYRSQLDAASPTATELGQLNLPPQVASLTANRSALLAENQLYRAQLTDSPASVNLTPDQQARFRSSQAELDSRSAAARLEVEQLQRQLSQTQAELATSQANLTVDEEILGGLEPLLEEGGIARVQVLRQEQEVRTRRGEVARLSQEQERLKLAIAQAQQRLQNTTALSRTELFNQIATNEKQLAEIDSQLNKIIIDNEKRIAEIDSQLSQSKLTLQYQELRAPVGGTVFDLQPSGAGFVANSSEPILKIVPDDALVAEVFVTNKDIGFVTENMNVDVRIDSFPFSEYGDVKGELIWIGSDALPPDQIHPFYRFPAKVQLDQQFLVINGREVPLQSGMSISANIKVRKRTVISIFTDLFTNKIESLRTVR